MLTYEPWKYSKPKKFIEASLFSEPSVDVSKLHVWPSELQEFLDEEQTSRAVFVNGEFVPQWSDSNLLTEVSVLKQNTTLPKEVSSLFKNEPSNKIRIHLKRETKQKVALLNLYDSSDSFRCQRQTEIFLEAGSNLDLAEIHLGSEDSHAFVQNRIHTKIDTSSKLKHMRFFSISDKTRVLDEHIASLGASAEAKFCQLNFGGEYIRNQMDVYLSGKEASVQAYGLTLGRKNNHIDNQTSIYHQFPHTLSEQLYKGIFSDQARGIFSGRIVIDKEAQKSNSSQFSRNLSLSDRAEIDTKPQLEVQADDVKAAHGATIGQLSDDELFYLQTRGIEKKSAQKILAEAFACEIIENFEFGISKKVVTRALKSKMERML